MNIKLVNGNAFVIEELPEVVDLSKKDLRVKISNFEEFKKGKLSIVLCYNNTKKVIDVKEEEFELPLNVLLNELDKVYFSYLDGSVSKFVAEPEKFKIKGLINVKDKDKLIDLLGLLYNKYLELEKKYEKLEKIVSEGDLLI